MQLRLTKKDLAEFGTLDSRSNAQVRGILNRLAPEQRTDLVRAMNSIEALLGAAPGDARTYALRGHRGDSGEAERSFRREAEQHSGMIPNAIGA